MLLSGKNKGKEKKRSVLFSALRGTGEMASAEELHEEERLVRNFEEAFEHIKEHVVRYRGRYVEASSLGEKSRHWFMLLWLQTQMDEVLLQADLFLTRLYRVIFSLRYLKARNLDFLREKRGEVNPVLGQALHRGDDIPLQTVQRAKDYVVQQP